MQELFENMQDKFDEFCQATQEFIDKLKESEGEE